MSAHAWCDRSVTDLLFTTRRNGVKCVKYILYEAALRGPAGGECVFFRLTEIKELSGSLWWMQEGSNLLRPVAGCGLFWHVGLAGVLRHKNLGSKSWSRIRVISFCYHGFPYSTIGDFLDPNIGVIRGPYCNISIRLVMLGDGSLVLNKQQAITWNNIKYRQLSDIRRTKSQNLNVSRLSLQLSLCNILKPDVKPRMKM